MSLPAMIEMAWQGRRAAAGGPRTALPPPRHAADCAAAPARYTSVRNGELGQRPG